MRTSAEALEDHKIKLTVEIDEADVAKAEDATLYRLTREVQLPGFRRGHVPRRVLQARLGTKGVREEVLRDALPGYYDSAIEEQNLDVISEPEIDITSGEDGGPVVFTATVEVRPEVEVPGYADLKVTIPSPLPTDKDVDDQIDRYRENFATLTEVDRPARDGDLVTLDIHGTKDGEAVEGFTADDLVYEVGSGGITEGIDEKLFGAKIGDAFDMAGPEEGVELKILVKQIREKVLPETDDEFAKDASEFDTIGELRDDILNRVASMKRYQAVMALRSNVQEALAELVTIDPPESLVAEQRNQLIQDLAYRFAQQRISLETYLQSLGDQSDAFVESFTEQAIKDVKADLALRAVAKAEDLEPDESEVDEEIVHLAGHANQTPAAAREALESNGRMPLVRAEIRKSKALRWLIDHVAIVDEQGNSVDRELLRSELAATEGHQEDDAEHVAGEAHDHEAHDHDEEN